MPSRISGRNACPEARSTFVISALWNYLWLSSFWSDGDALQPALQRERNHRGAVQAVMGLGYCTAYYRYTLVTTPKGL